MKRFILIIVFTLFGLNPNNALGLAALDMDNDGLSDKEEAEIYFTDPALPDTDGDGFKDGDEVKYLYDPNKAGDDKLSKLINVNLSDQSLAYFLGRYLVGSFKISSGAVRTPTPAGSFEVMLKRPLVNYRGPGYSYPKTRWNLMFKEGSWGNYYIHGAYWHNKFGQPVSRGCINAPYANMQALYEWADVGTKLVISK